RGESAAEEAYDDALRHDLPAEIRQVVREQHRRVRETRNRYRAMAGTGRSAKGTGELAHRLTAGTESVTHYMHERPLMSSMVVFALGFLVGALTIASMSAGQSYQPPRRRFW